jgi:toxin FitB
MNVVDSSGWLEYFANARNADFFAPAIQDEERLLVPTICLYEVFKRLHQQLGKDSAIEGVSRLLRGTITDLDEEIAMLAAQVSITHHLPLADSIFLATAQAHQATFWTQDEHFNHIPGVRYVQKQET